MSTGRDQFSPQYCKEYSGTGDAVDVLRNQAIIIHNNVTEGQSSSLEVTETLTVMFLFMTYFV